MSVLLGIVIAIALVAGLLLAAAIRILREYERGVVFRLGRLLGPKGPGLVLLIPVIDKMVKVDLRTVTLNIPPQDVITRDNVPARVNAVAYFKVVDSVNSVVEVENFLQATSQISQTTLRSVLGKADLDTLLSERERLNDDLQQIIDEQTEPWGVKVSVVEIKDVELPADMQRAMARQAEAERNRRARVINAEGEFQASQKLFDASEVISQNPAGLQLRYLQTLGDLGVNQNTTIVFPVPMDLLQGLSRLAGTHRDGGGPTTGADDAPAYGAAMDDDKPAAPPHDQQHAEPLGPLTPDDETPLGDTPEAHDEISPHDLPPDHPARERAEEQASRGGGLTRGDVGDEG